MALPSAAWLATSPALTAHLSAAPALTALPSAGRVATSPALMALPSAAWLVAAFSAWGAGAAARRALGRP